MKIIPNAIPYRWILPIAQIVICTVLLLPIRYGGIQKQTTGYQFEFSVTTPQPQLSSEGRTYEIHQLPEYPENPWIEKLGSIRLQTPALLNLPVMIVALPYAILSPTKNDWVPRGMDVRTWRAISWPFVGLIFWWVAGLGIEALVSARNAIISSKIRWFHLVIALLALACGAICILIPLCGVEDSPIPVGLYGVAGGMWVLLGGSTVAARTIQWRIRLKTKAARTIGGVPS
jgi:hypothetical protein